MVHLNHFLKKKYVSRVYLGTSIIFLLIGSFLEAKTIQFFDPTFEYKKDTLYSDFQLFLANDPISLYEFFNDWKSDYDAKEGSNVALLDARFDIGSTFMNGYYFGYFYRYNVFIDTNKDFTDLFYAIKNKQTLEAQKEYDLLLDIEAIKQHGLVIAKNHKFYVNERFSLDIGVALSLSYSIDMQDGYVDGKGRVIGEKDYEVEAKSSYFYTKNYLYDLDANSASGYGYGFDIGVNFEDKTNGIGLKFIVNDIINKIYWQDLPYSKILLKTENKSYDEDNYAKYAPSISGLEKYLDYTQTLSARYKAEGSFVSESRTFFAGVDYVYNELFPYIKLDQQIDEKNSMEFYYGTRFGSFGIGYIGDLFKVGAVFNDISTPSSLGVHSSFIYKF